jgi:lysozyme
MPHINTAGLTLIRNFEGCRLQAYDDGTGVWTIGFGHTGSGVRPGLTWTQDQADQALLDDLAVYEKGVNDLISRNLSSNQFSALVSFAYNVGLGALGNSTLLRLLNAGDIAGAADQFLRWDSPGTNVQAGLDRRRKAERALFLTPDGG